MSVSEKFEDREAEANADSRVDAISASLLVILAAATAIFWVSNQ